MSLFRSDFIGSKLECFGLAVASGSMRVFDYWVGGGGCVGTLRIVLTVRSMFWKQFEFLHFIKIVFLLV